MMAATIIIEPVMVVVQETQSPSSSPSSNKMDTATSCTTQTEIESANCDCCGLTEECTSGYIERVWEMHAGKWICGLCAEAVQDEILRSDRLIAMEQALATHFKVYGKFRCTRTPETDPTVELISAMRQILRRSLECPRGGKILKGVALGEV